MIRSLIGWLERGELPGPAFPYLEVRARSEGSIATDADGEVAQRIPPTDRQRGLAGGPVAPASVI